MADRYDDLDEYNWLMMHIILRESAQANGLGLLLMKHLTDVDHSVIDFGCGPGNYLLPFIAKKWFAYGVDGASGAGELLAVDSYEKVDLRNPWRYMPSLSARFGLSLCVEVGEHINQEYADTLVRTIATNTQKYIFFCAARPGQGGENHVNEQHQPYWLEKFEREGFTVSPLNYPIKVEIEEGDLYESCRWLRWNSMLLERR